MSKQKIMVVVDPTASEQPAARRGIQLCRQLDCSLELVVCVHDAEFAGRHFLDRKLRDDVRREALQMQLRFLESLRAELNAGDIEVSIRGVWDTPLAEAISRAALRLDPVLVLKDTHHHGTLSRTLFTGTDWELIRTCPAPLWLVKNKTFDKPVVLAAVDPSHEHEKPAKLDGLVLDWATRIAGGFDSPMHVYHGYDSVADIASAGAFSISPEVVPIDDINARVKTEHEAAFRELLAGLSLPDDHRHLLPGRAADILPALARKLDAGIVVMGAVARGRLKRATIGNTAERTLDQLPCDVLIVKPSSFDCPVTYKAQAPDFTELMAVDA